MLLSSFEPALARGVSRSAVTVERVVECPFSLALEEAHVIFTLLASGERGVRLPFRQLHLPFEGALTRSVTTHFHRQRDTTEAGRPHEEVEFDWCADSRWLPDLHGVLRFRIAALKTRLILSADYVPPFGRFGSLFDRLGGRYLARATATDVLDRLARALERRWAQERGA
jgi:hypothetical protein